jgi:glycosyltransferase involved in cell wall biosynthesis
VKILFVNEKAGYFGGVEQNIADSAAGLKARGTSCFLAYGETTDRDPRGYQAIFEESRVCRELAPGSVPSAQSFRDLVERLRPDVVYLHKISKVSPVLPFSGKVRTVRMVHDHDLCCPRRHKYYLLNSRVCRHPAGWRCYLDGAFLERGTQSRLPFCYAAIGPKLREMRRNTRLDSILVGSRFMHQELVANGFSASKIHVLPPVVPDEDLPSSPVPNDPIVLYVGQLIRGKGVDLLLRSLQRLPCDFQAVIIGTGNAESKLHALCDQLGLKSRVQFHGWVDHQQLGAFYERARVVAVPSRWPEPFGMIGLEAMRRARPVVAFNVGGIPDWLEDGVTGTLVCEQDVDGFARALQRILSDDALANELGQAARLRAHERFSFDRYVDRLRALLLGEGPEHNPRLFTSDEE